MKTWDVLDRETGTHLSGPHTLWSNETLDEEAIGQDEVLYCRETREVVYL